MAHNNGQADLGQLEDEVEANVERERREHDLLDEEKMGMGELEEERMKPQRSPADGKQERD